MASRHSLLTVWETLWKVNGTCLNLPRAGRPHKLSDHARRMVREGPPKTTPTE